MKPLTSRQQDVLSFVHDFLGQNGFAPTLQEIGDGIGLNYTNAVRGHLAALEKKGYVTRAPDKARSIRIIHEPSPLSRLKRKLHEVLRTDEGVLHDVVYGLAWATWRCRPYLTGSLQERMAEAFERETAEHGWDLLDKKIEPNHVVLVVKAWPNHSPELAVRRFKGAGEAMIRRQSRRVADGRLWARGYTATTNIELLGELVHKLLEEEAQMKDSD